jgi:hypothetical protein
MSRLQAEEAHPKLHPRADVGEPGSVVADKLKQPKNQCGTTHQDEKWGFPATPGAGSFILGCFLRAPLPRGPRPVVLEQLLLEQSFTL